MTDHSTREPAARRPGRPRKRPLRPGTSPREQILDVAAGLFIEQGFGATTTRQIAAGAGLEQGSLFHHFARKDDMLAELLERTLQPAVDHAAWLDGQSIPPQEKLYLLTYCDALSICSGPHNISALCSLPEAKLPAFEEYQEKERWLKQRYVVYIDAAFAEGTFAGIPPPLAAEFVFAMAESSIRWFVRGRDDAPEAATAVATAVLRLLLSDGRRLRSVIHRAMEHWAQRPEELLDAAEHGPIPRADREGGTGPVTTSV